MRPEIRRARRHDVDMRLKNQGASPFLAGAMDADHDRRRRMDVAELPAASVAFDRLTLHREPFHRKAARAEGAEHEVLDRMLGPANRGESHQLSRMSDLLGEAGLDRSDDRMASFGVSRRRHFSSEGDGG